MDTRLLRKKSGFDQLADSYVIFITENDVLKAGLPLYNIERRIVQTDKSFNDGSNIIYVNGSYKTTETPLGQLIHDFFCERSKDIFNDVLADRYKYLKETEEGESNMCQIIDELIEERIKEVTAEAAEKKSRFHSIKRMILKKNNSLEDIADIFNMPVEEIQNIADEVYA